MKLYDLKISANCHKVRLMLSMLGLEYETQEMDLKSGELKHPAFLEKNPRGQVPVLEDEGRVVWDSQAILVYLARRYGGEDWLPIEPAAMAEVMQWMAVSENEIMYGLRMARAIVILGVAGDVEQAQALGHAGLGAMERRLENHDWLALDRPTIAEPACHPYVALAPEGNIDLKPYPAVTRWIDRVKALRGYIGMPGT